MINPAPAPVVRLRRFPVPSWRLPRRRRKFRLRLPQWIEYFLFRAAESAVLALPYRAAVALSRVVARALYAVDGKHRAIACENIAQAYPEWAPRRIAGVARAAFEHFALVLVEMFFTRRLFRAGTANRHSSWVGEERVDKALRAGKGLVIVTGHIGNWEFSALAGAMRGMPLTCVARPLDNRWINDHLARYRVSTGMEVVYKKDALRRMVACLRENRVVVLPCDQNMRENGVFVPFFGRLASTIRSAALLSRKYGAPLVVGIQRRTSSVPFHYSIEFAPITRPEDFDGEPDPVQAMTAHFTRQLEQQIRVDPRQYLWMHKRWKTRPEGEAASAGPLSPVGAGAAAG